jgi:hypothetical protein
MSGPWVWRAIATGAAIAVGVGLALSAFGFFAGALMEVVGVPVVAWGMRLAGLAGDFASGLVAGRIAGRDGALHGVVVGAIGAVVGLLFVLPQWLSMPIDLPASYWLQVALWTVVGWVLAIVGGALGAQSRRSAGS